MRKENRGLESRKRGVKRQMGAGCFRGMGFDDDRGGSKNKFSMIHMAEEEERENNKKK